MPFVQYAVSFVRSGPEPCAEAPNFREESMSTNPPAPAVAAEADNATHPPDERQRRMILIAVCVALMAVIAPLLGWW